MAFDVVWNYIINDRYTSKIRAMARATRGIVNTVGRASASLKKMGYQLTSLRNIISASYGAAMVAFPIKQAVNFEAAMINIQRIVDFKSRDQFAQFREGLIQTAIHLGKLPVDLAKMAYEGAKITGTSAGLEKFIELTSKAAVAFDLDDVFAGEVIGRMKEKFGMTIEETERLMDAINYLGDHTSTSGKKIVQTIGYAVAALAKMRMPAELSAGWTAFSSIIMKTPRLAASALRILEEDLSKSRKFGKDMLIDSHGTIMKLLEKLERMDKGTISSLARRGRYIRRNFSKPAARWLEAAVNNMEVLRRTFRLVGDDSSWVGSMLRELNKKLASALTALERIKSVSNAIAITIGNAFLPMIKELAPHVIRIALQFREWARTHPKIVKIAIAIIAIITVLTTVGVVVGLIAIAIGALISPIGLIIMGVIAIGSFFVYAYKRSDKLRAAISRLGVAFKPIWNWIKKLWKATDGWGISLDAIFKIFEIVAVAAVDFLTDNVHNLIYTIEMAVSSVESLYEWFKKLFEFATIDKISEIGKDIKDKAIDIYNTLDEEPEWFKKMFGGDNESVSAKEKMMNANINGEIVVSAKKGSAIERAFFDITPSGQMGLNMERR